MEHKVVGKGAVGCVVEPSIQCQNSEYTDGSDLVSKVISVQNSEQHLKKSALEIEIATKLNKVDPANIYFLGPLSMCKLNKQQQTQLIEICEMDNSPPQEQIYFNLPMKRAYGFQTILQILSSTTNLMLSCAHLIEAIKLCSEEANIVHMDIKTNNIMFNIYDNHLHPVFIDFSPVHIFEKTHEGFAQYISHWGEALYYTWPPEIKVLIQMQHHNQDFLLSVFESMKFTREMNKIVLKKQTEPDKVLTIPSFNKFVEAMMDNLNYYHDVFSENNPVKLQILAEKMMLWQLAQTMIHVFPDVVYINERAKRFLGLLLTMMDLRIKNRLTCHECLDRLDDIIGHNQLRNDIFRYMIPIDDSVTAQLEQ